MKSMLSSRLKYGVSALAVATGFTLIAPSALAQDTAMADEDMMLEEVVVTGSRIKRKDVESVSPLTVTGAEEIKFSGYTRMEDMLNSLPQLEAAQNAFIANGATGTASLDLRGLSPVRTLVLVNGRRLQPGGVYTNSPDINQIPAGLVERVEVVTGGASSTYGADAIAGVVNFVMDKNFEGVEISAGISAYQHNNNNDYLPPLMDDAGYDYPSGSTWGGEQYNIDMIAGGNFADDRGHVTVYANWRKVEELRQGDRDYSSCALNANGTACGGSANAIVPNFDIYPIDPNTGETVYEGTFNGADANKWYTLDPNGGFTSADGNLYNYAPVNHFQRPDERWSGGAFLNYEVNDYFKPYMEVSFTRDRTVAQIAESGTFFNEEYHLSCSSPLLSAQQQAEICGDYGLNPDDEFAVFIGKRNVEGGPRQARLEHNSFRIVTGSEGDISDNWRYDVSFQYGSTTSSESYVNDFFADKIRDAVNVESDNGELVCMSGSDTCIPYEIFTYEGVTSEQAKNLTGVGILNGITKEYVLNGYVAGDLPLTIPSASDPIQVVFGAEYRKEVFERLSDEVYEQGLLLGQGGPTVSVAGDYDVKEVFGEAFVPLVQDVEFAQEVSMELGLRLSDYSSVGSTETYKVGLNWQPVDMVKFRASYNRAVRAPNVLELFVPQNLGLWEGADPCASDNPTLTVEQCARTGANGYVNPSPASQYNGLFGGNPDLDPEVADTWTLGLVANPFEGFRFSVDYWDIKVEDVIDTISEELAITQCGETGDAIFCDLINRSPSGSLWLGQEGYVTATNINLGSRHWQGIDFTADYVMDIGDGGTFRADFMGSWLLKKFTEEIPGLESSQYDCKGVISSNCYASPEWRHTLRLTYASDSFWTASVKWRFFGSVDNPEVDTGLNAGIDAQSYFDLTGTFDINETVGLVVGVNNVFDKEPPLIGGKYSENGNTIAGFYDTLGRYLHATVTAKF